MFVSFKNIQNWSLPLLKNVLCLLITYKHIFIKFIGENLSALANIDSFLSDGLSHGQSIAFFSPHVEITGTLQMPVVWYMWKYDSFLIVNALLSLLREGSLCAEGSVWFLVATESLWGDEMKIWWDIVLLSPFGWNRIITKEERKYEVIKLNK